jgi:uncharacterized metal-binding protein YceD (DUF177 family)
MSTSPPEFSRPVPLARLGAEPFRQQIEATPQERERLARRFDVLALDRLAAVVTLHRESGDLIRLEAVFEAELTQSCVVTLDPVPAQIVQSFVLLYGPAEEEQHEIELDVDEPVFEPLTGDGIDIGEAVAQEFSLALPEFPRLPDAAVEPDAAGEPQSGPFAGLARLRGSPQS